MDDIYEFAKNFSTRVDEVEEVRLRFGVKDGTKGGTAAVGRQRGGLHAPTKGAAHPLLPADAHQQPHLEEPHRRHRGHHGGGGAQLWVQVGVQLLGRHFGVTSRCWEARGGRGLGLRALSFGYGDPWGGDG